MNRRSAILPASERAGGRTGAGGVDRSTWPLVPDVSGFPSWLRSAMGPHLRLWPQPPLRTTRWPALSRTTMSLFAPASTLPMRWNARCRSTAFGKSRPSRYELPESTIMSDLVPCPVCTTAAQMLRPRDHGNDVPWDCPRCRTFRVLGSADGLLDRLDSQQRAKVSGWLFERNAEGSVPTITQDILEQVIARRLPTIKERADRLLLEALKGQTSLARLSISTSRALSRQPTLRTSRRLNSSFGPFPKTAT